MRICLITSSYPRFEQDGNARSIRSIAEALSAWGHEVEIVAPYSTSIRPYASPAPVHWFRYALPSHLHIMGHGRNLSSDSRLYLSSFIMLPLFLIAAFRALMQVTGTQRSQVIYVHWVLPSGLVAAWVGALRKIPFVINVHGSDMFTVTHNRLFRAVARWVFRRAAAVIACSPDLRAAAVSLGAPKDTLLLAWGADPALFNPRRHTIQTRSLFGWGKSEIIVSALGRMVPKKGFDVLIKALPLISAVCPQVRLAFGGDGPLCEQLMGEARDLGMSDHVTFHGRIEWDRVPDFLAASDIFVLPSIRDEQGNVDGLPSVLLDAMSSGAAVVASEIAGVPLVVDDGRTGILVPPGDYRALANAILLLIDDTERRQALAQAARRAIEERYNWKKVTQQIADFIAKAVTPLPNRT